MLIISYTLPLIVSALALPYAMAETQRFDSAKLQDKVTAFHHKITPSMKFQDDFLLRAARRYNANNSENQKRQRQLDDGSCTGDAFLWLIKDMNYDDFVVGYGVGTMHLATDYVTTEEAWKSIENAIDDSCTVYGELNVLEEATLDELTDCSEDIVAKDGMLFLSDIPDSSLRAQYESKVRTIVEEYVPSFQVTAFTSAILDFPLGTIQSMIEMHNTPELKDYFFGVLFEGATVKLSLDEDILSLGRPADALEEVETQCEILDHISPTKSEFTNDWEIFWKEEVESVLTSSLSDFINAYKCGDREGINAIMAEEMIADTDYELRLNELLWTNRNVDMADNIALILNEQTSSSSSSSTLEYGAPRTLFAVGLGHFITGENSLEILLPERGYKLERVVGPYNADDYPNMSDGMCSESSTIGTLFFPLVIAIAGSSMFSIFMS